MNSRNSKNILLDKSFSFAIRIVNLYKFLCMNKKEFILSKQILRSGTSVGANIEEANGAISKSDFSSKISVAHKESRETKYWLKLLFETGYLNKKSFESLTLDCDELSRLTFSVLKTTGRIKKRANANKK